MENIVEKLKEKKIFKEETLIEAEVTKSFMGSPVTKKVILRVRNLVKTIV